MPVDHLHGHVASLYLKPTDLEPPFVCLLASGGHTLLLDVQDRSGYRVIGTTLDDAAGEAFDKGARLLGLGYPGGAAIDQLARQGDPSAYEFPVARVPGLDFSFSGVKTALLYAVRGTPDLDERRADLAASYQRAIVRALVERLRQAADGRTAAIVGGVAANSELRAALPDAVAAPLELCTDNAAMIASAGRYTEPACRPAPAGRLCGGVAQGPPGGGRGRGPAAIVVVPAGGGGTACGPRASTRPPPGAGSSAARAPRSAPASGCSSC